MKKRVLVVDIGGSHVKLLMSQKDQRRFVSGPRMTPRDFVRNFKETTQGWSFEAVSIGFPSPIRQGHIVRNPKHLGEGWIGFDFRKPLGKPVHVINDASMQALGSYRGRGRTLFLGLGTGLGSALVWERTLFPLELGDLPYRDGDIIEQWVGQPGLERLGRKKWMREVEFVITHLKKSFIADCVVLGGGNARFFDELPKGFERGDNRDAYQGGVRLWEMDNRIREKKWRVI